MPEYGFADPAWTYDPDDPEGWSRVLDLARMSAESCAQELGFDLDGVSYHDMIASRYTSQRRVGWYIDTGGSA